MTPLGMLSVVISLLPLAAFTIGGIVLTISLARQRELREMDWPWLEAQRTRQ